MPVFNRATLSLAVFLAGVACSKKPQQAAGPPDPSMFPPVPVSIAKATQESVPLEVSGVGNVEAVSTVQVRSRVTGQLTKVHFTEGQRVAKDQLLFQIDPRTFQDALRQAEAAVARDRAEIRSAEASLARDLAQARNADAEAARYAQLVKAGDISRSQADKVRTSAEVFRESAHAAEAVIEKSKAALQADIAAVDQAKLLLSWCEIRAPFAGRTGPLLIHAGNLVKENDTPIVVIHQMSPIHVTFTVPEQHLDTIRRLAGTRKLPVRVSFQNSSTELERGQLAMIDNAVDTATGTIRLKAAFENKSGALWPGQFVNATLTLDTLDNATVVPAEAVQAGQQGQFVFAVKSDQSVEIRPVTPGRSVAGRMVIQSGVAPGDTVVTDGHLRLFPGAKIQPVDAKKIQDTKL